MITNKKNISLFAIFIMIFLLIACSGQEVEQAESSAQDEVAQQDSQPQVTNEDDSAPASSSPENTNDAESSADEENGMRTFVLVPEESRASYLVDEEFFEEALSKLGIEAGEKDVVGSSQVIEGQLQLNPDDMSNLLGENMFTVDMRTFKTDQDRRDNWILNEGPQFNQFPEATFTATEVSGVPDNYVEGQEIQFDMSGDLTIHEVSIPVTFDVSAALEGDTLTGTAETRQLMSDFGIEPPSFARTLTVADEFGMRIEFTAREQ